MRAATLIFYAGVTLFVGLDSAVIGAGRVLATMLDQPQNAENFDLVLAWVAVAFAIYFLVLAIFYLATRDPEPRE